MSYRYQEMTVVFAMILVAALGVFVSFLSANHLRETEYATWASDARAETYQLSEILHDKLYRTEGVLRAISERFRARGTIEPDAFRSLISLSRNWDPEIRFDTVAFAERLDRAKRLELERSERVTLAVAGDPGAEAPLAAEAFAVRAVSPPDDLLRPLTDVMTHPELQETLVTARQLPGSAVLGPSFVGKDGQRKIPAAITVDLEDRDGIILAVFDLTHFIADSLGGILPEGMGMRLVERETEAAATMRQTAILGSMQASENVETYVVRLSKGIARWSLHWDVSQRYRGGPNATTEKIALYGGSAISFFFAGALGYLIILSLRFREQVREKTAELSRKAMIIQLTMDTIDQGFAVWNSDQRLVVWSKRCQDFWYQPGSWLVPGTHMSRLIRHLAEHGAFGGEAGDDVVEREMGRVVAAGVDSQERFNLVDGTHVHVRRFPLEHGGHVAVYTDTSVQDRAMTQLERSRDAMEAEVKRRTHDLIIARDQAEQANLAKTYFLANVSHELRTPLNAIIGFADMIGLNIGKEGRNATFREYSQLIKGAGESLLSVVSDLLDVSRIEAGMFEIEREETDVAATVKDVLAVMQPKAEKRSVALVSKVAENLPYLYVDASRFKQILNNLTDNAVKFSSAGGTVEVSAELNGLGNLVVCIEDAGIGISKDDLARVLEPFVQVENVMIRTHEGVGLGLPLARSLTELMDGTFVVESALGEGTRIRLTFPSGRVGPKGAAV